MSHKPKSKSNIKGTLPKLNNYSTKGHAMCSAMLTEVDEKLGAYALGQQSPRDFVQAIKRAAIFKQDNWFVQTILGLRLAFYNYGFRLKPADGSAVTAALKTWLKKNADPVDSYVQEVWNEWLNFDNAVSFWWPAGERPILLHLTDCIYTDNFGTPTLKYRHRLNAAQIEALDLPVEIKAQMRLKPEIDLPPDQFHVLKRSKLGAGFAWPKIMSIAKAFAQSESMEVADNILAYVCRHVIEQHKMGHEISSGPHAGWNTHFWKKERAEAFKKAIKGMIGHIRITTNFDHEIVYPYPDQKNFDATKYDSVIKRMTAWAAPLGQMLEAKALAPYLMDFLRTQAEAERALVAKNINHVINEGFFPKPPVELMAVWSNRVFRESRTASDLLKFAVAQGAASQTTLLNELGADPEEEREFKKEEDKLPVAQTQPIYDPNHGAPDAKPPKGPSGKPGGAKNSK